MQEKLALHIRPHAASARHGPVNGLASEACIQGFGLLAGYHFKAALLAPA